VSKSIGEPVIDMFSSFIFRITNLCDKRCPTCCCETGLDVIDPEKLRKKLLEISDFFKIRPDDECNIFLTGGEPFFYRNKSDGKIWNIVDIVNLIKTNVPSSNIIIKTSGWEKNDLLDSLVCSIGAKGKVAEVRLGFNLFQKLGVNAEKRLNHMLSLLLAFQDSVVVETIYNKKNMDQTLRIIGNALGSFSKEFEKFGDAILSPRESYVVEFPFTVLIENNLNQKTQLEKKISLWTMPAHSGKSKKMQQDYYDCEKSGICNNIKFGPTQIMYNADFSFNHCNDAFADFSYPAFTSRSDWTVKDEFIFLSEKFVKLRDNLGNGARFRSKNEQCDFCSKLIHEF
jgi:hypothetical protein